MRLYLSADIEGTCGIADWAETCLLYTSDAADE